MDTFKDKQTLDDLYVSGKAPWQIWNGPAKSDSVPSMRLVDPVAKTL
jgi:hypothetical protein